MEGVQVKLKKVHFKGLWSQVFFDTWQMYSKAFRQSVSKCYCGRGQAVTVRTVTLVRSRSEMSDGAALVSSDIQNSI